MDSSFWHKKWQAQEIAFHLTGPNPHLVEHFTHLKLPAQSRIFIPLCGKTLDAAWLMSQGHHVVGAELVELAIVQLFQELGLSPRIIESEVFKHYSAPSIDIFVGDVFELNSEVLGHVDAVYDRAALVALPEDLRKRYAAHLLVISKQAPQLLITYEYDQDLLAGPPFSVSATEVQKHYPSSQLIEAHELPGAFKGKCPAKECVWLIPSSTSHKQSL